MTLPNIGSTQHTAGVTAGCFPRPGDDDKLIGMEKQQYGSTDVQLSIVGFGGILVRNETSEESSRLVAKAVDRGVNYFDVAPSYGNAQEMLGPALKPYRKDVFLACKTQKRSAGEAQEELDESCRLLKTDYFDLYQLHAVTTDEDVEAILAPGGALEVFTKARDEGRVRYLGFSAHSETAAHALLDAFSFDSVLFPVNWVTWTKEEFGPSVIERVLAGGKAVLALKALAKRTWLENEEREWSKTWYKPVDTYEEAARGLRFTLSKGATAAVSPGHEKLFDWICDAADEIRDVSETDLAEIEAEAAKLQPIFPVAQQ